MIAKRIENKIVREWFLSAQDDEDAIESILKDKEWTANTVCFLSQQMAEKYLKGFLVFSKKEVPRIHQLENLLKLCIAVNDGFTILQESSQYLSGFYIATRYPGEYQQFSREEAKRAFSDALKIKNFISSKILE